jgi:tetratricopeptide (TPR) repeat protein
MGSNEPPQIDVLCRANEETSITVYDDEPLIFSVAMVNDDAATAASYNTPLEDQIREIERKFKAEQMEEKEFKRAVEEIERNMLKVRVYRFGSPLGWPHYIKFQALSGDTWRYVNWPLKLLIYHPATQVVDLDASTSCYVEFGLDPEDPQRPKDEFQVKAVVEIAKDITVESDVVTINFLQQKMPKAETSKEGFLLAKGEYAYKRGLYEDAKEYTQRVLKANPHSLLALNLLGEIEEGKKDLSAALSAYEKALEEAYEQYPDRREPPRALLNKIRRIRAMMQE